MIFTQHNTSLSSSHQRRTKRLVALLAPLVVLLVERLRLGESAIRPESAHNSHFTSDMASPGPAMFLLLPDRRKTTHLRQVDVRDDDLVQGAGSVLARLGGVAVRVVLVGGVAAGLPGLGAVGLADLVLAAGRRRVGAEVPAGEAEGAGHDCEENLCTSAPWSVLFAALLSGRFLGS